MPTMLRVVRLAVCLSVVLLSAGSALAQTSAGLTNVSFVDGTTATGTFSVQQSGALTPSSTITLSGPFVGTVALTQASTINHTSPVAFTEWVFAEPGATGVCSRGAACGVSYVSLTKLPGSNVFLCGLCSDNPFSDANIRNATSSSYTGSPGAGGHGATISPSTPRGGYETFEPKFTTQPTSRSVFATTTSETVTFTAVASGNPAPTYLWQVSRNGGTSWSNLSNGAPYSGASTGTLTINVSEAISVEGLGIAHYRVWATNTSGSTPSNEVTLTIASLRLFDPLSDDPVNDVITANGTFRLGRLDDGHSLRVVKGAVTDGLTVLLLRVQSASTVRFRMSTSDGTLSPLSTSSGALCVDGSLSCVDGEPLDSSSGSYAWVSYRPPTQFGPTNDPSRVVHVSVELLDGTSTLLPIRIERTPVVLVHGQWDNPSVWGETGFHASLEASGFRVTRANYDLLFANSSSWHPGRRPTFSIMLVQSAIEDALAQTRARELAVVQADVVAHSMGGLVVRSLMQQDECEPWKRHQCYKDSRNLQKGWIRRLITIGTPHFGTPMAESILLNRNNSVVIPRLNLLGTLKFWMGLTGRWVERGSVESMVPGSPELRMLKSTCEGGINVKGYGIVGAVQPLSIPGEIEFGFYLGQVPPSEQIFVGEMHDGLVDVQSQWGRTTPPQSIFFETVHSPSYTPWITDSHWIFADAVSAPANVAIQAKVADLLDTHAEDPELACFPAPFPSGQTPATLLNSRSARVEAPDPSSGIRITAPVEGLPIRRGDGTQVTLAVEATGGWSPTEVTFFMRDRVVARTTAAPFGTTLVLPSEIALGPMSVMAIARDSAGNMRAAVVAVTVVTSSAPTSISTNPTALVFRSGTSLPKQLAVAGKFAESGADIVHDIAAAALGTTYTTQHGDAVVRVSPNGLVTRVAAGEDTITVTNNGRTAAVPVTVDCSYSLSAGQLSIGNAGGTTTITVTPDVSSCVWNAASDVDWITVSGNDGGTGTGTLTLIVAANDSGVERSGTIGVAGLTLTLLQTDAVSAPAVSVHPASQSVPAGQSALFSFTVSGTPVPAYQWQVSANGGDSWAAITDGELYSGTQASVLTVNNPAASLNQLHYRGVATNTAGSVTTTPATLTVRGAIASSHAHVAFSATKVWSATDLVSTSPPQTIAVSFEGAPSDWSVTANQPWLQVADSSGSGNGAFVASVINPGNVISGGASLNAALTITSATSPNSPLTIPVVLSVNFTNGFVDDPVVAGVTQVRAAQIVELRARINAQRVRFGLAPVAWADATLAGAPVRAAHVLELRSALAAAYVAAGRSEPSFSDGSLAATASIRAVHVTELRSAIVSLELFGA
jgi:pimeloyl-ACP methyl ester carboxylesterase